MERGVNAHGLMCIGIAGTTLLAAETELLARGVRNVILFARNYQNAAQLTQLTAAIRKAAGANVLISVDQEGGRVLRFCGAPFPEQQSARLLGEQGVHVVAQWTRDTALALRLRRKHELGSNFGCGQQCEESCDWRSIIQP